MKKTINVHTALVKTPSEKVYVEEKKNITARIVVNGGRLTELVQG